MKLSKRATKQIATIEKAFGGIKATMKIYQKNYKKVFETFDATDSEHGKIYNSAIRKVNGFVIEGNSIVDTVATNLNNVVVNNQRFKYMTYNELCNRKLSQEDIKKICHYLTDLQAKYMRIMSQIKEIQFNAMRESMEIVTNDIFANFHKYECHVSIGPTWIDGREHVNMAWYHNGDYICSTHPIPSNKPADAPADKTPDVKPADEKKSFSISDDKKE